MKLTKVVLWAVFAMAALHLAAAEAQQLPARRVNRAPASVSPAPTPVPYLAPAVPVSPAAVSGPRASSFKWDLYIDVQARLPSRDTLPDRGFTLNDAALYMTKDFGRGVQGLVELPFSSDTSGRSASVLFGESRAQAYVEFARSSPLYFRAGQYNTFLGVEANDSRDRFFADFGLIKGLLLPRTHTGVQVGYHTPQAVFNGQITDPNGMSTMSSQNPEIGINGRIQGDAAYGAAGLTVNDEKTTTSGNRTNMIFDLMGGWGTNQFKIDGELVWLKQAGSDKNGTALGVFATYAMDDAFTLGGRLEYGRDVGIPVTAAPAGVFESILALSAGPSYGFQPDLVFRGDFSLMNMKSPTFDDTIYALSASMVASF